MADATTNLSLRWRGNAKEWGRTERIVLDNSAAMTVYRGSPMWIDANVDTIYARIFVTGSAVATGDQVLGIALEGKVVATADTETDNEINIWTWGEIGGVWAHSLTNANRGDAVYFDDSGTLTATAGTNLLIGYLTAIEDSYVYIMVNGGNGAPHNHA